jgi:hypothetical protein
MPQLHKPAKKIKRKVREIMGMTTPTISNASHSRIKPLLLVVIVAVVGTIMLALSRAEVTGCTQVLNTSSNVSATVQSAPGGTTICLSAGTYPPLSLTGQHSSDVVLTNVPGEKVTIGPTGNTGYGVSIQPNSNHIVIRNFYINGGVDVGDSTTISASYITIDHNDIAPYGLGINMGGANCQALNAPSYGKDPTCISAKPVSNIVISGNRIRYPKSTEELAVNIQQDAIHINYFENVTVKENEITNVLTPTTGARVYTAAHNDCLQTVWGGSNLTYEKNYLHDNDCQEVFLKDGDVTNANIVNNLFLRNDVNLQPLKSIQIFHTTNLVIRNNTNWSDSASVLRTTSTNSYTALTDHNIFQTFDNGCCSEPKYILTENDNTYRKAPFTFTISPTSMVNATPGFVNPTADDYRLADNPKGIGVNWKPADYAYGPLGIGSALPPTTTPPPTIPPPTTTPLPTPPPPTTDTSHPSAPTALIAQANAATKVTLYWKTATDNVGVAKYNVLRNGAVIGSVSGTTTTYIDTTTAASTQYAYTVIALDAANNASSPSNTATITTPAIPDTAAPTAPASFAAKPASSYQVNLSWLASTDTGGSGLKGYYIYRNGIKLNTTPLATTSYGDATASPNTTYTYAVQAVDGAGNVSALASSTAKTAALTPVNLTFSPTADAVIKKSFPNKAFGKSSSVKVDAYPMENALYKFSVSGVQGRTVIGAKMRLYVTNGSLKGGDFFKASTNSWDENTVTWNNAPTLASSTPLARLGAVYTNNYVDVDLSNLIYADGTYSIRANSTSGDGATYLSRESSSYKPVLILMVAQ